MSPAETFEQHRSYLFAIAYRMLGSAMEAEDMVQETYLRYQDAAPSDLRSPRAFLSTIITRLCLDHLKSARVQRESYPGEWLPEPVVVDEPAAPGTPDQLLSRYESISVAFLVLLESLTPVERAVFLLREVFDYEYDEIATVVEKSAANCRQLYRRAKTHINARKPRYDTSQAQQQALIGRFMQAVSVGDLTSLTALLAQDAVAYSDSGGKVKSATRRITGADRVGRFLIGLVRKAQTLDMTIQIELRMVNAGPALVTWHDGHLFNVITFAFADAHITEIGLIVNPDKLRYLEAQLGRNEA